MSKAPDHSPDCEMLKSSAHCVDECNCGAWQRKVSMSKAPETIYINAAKPDEDFPSLGYWWNARSFDSDIPYVHHSIAYKYASEVESLKGALATLHGRPFSERVYVALHARMEAAEKQAEIQAESLRVSNAEVERLRASIASLAERMRNYHPCHDAGPAYAAGKASATAHWLKEIESIAAQESGLSQPEIERQSRRVE